MLTISTAVSVGSFGVNSYVVRGVAGVVVVDLPEPFGRVRDILDREDVEVSAAVITHAHIDHMAGLPAFRAAFPRAEVAASAGAAEAFGRPTMNLSLLAGGARAFDAPSILLEDGGMFDAGGICFRVIVVDGHAPGCVCLFHEEEKVLFCGDVLFAGGIGRTDLPGGSMERLIAGIREKLLVLPDETRVFPGHGPSTTIGEERRSNPFLKEAAGWVS